MIFNFAKPNEEELNRLVSLIKAYSIDYKLLEKIEYEVVLDVMHPNWFRLLKFLTQLNEKKFI